MTTLYWFYCPCCHVKCLQVVFNLQDSNNCCQILYADNLAIIWSSFHCRLSLWVPGLPGKCSECPDPPTFRFAHSHSTGAQAQLLLTVCTEPIFCGFLLRVWCYGLRTFVRACLLLQGTCFCIKEKEGEGGRRGRKKGRKERKHREEGGRTVTWYTHFILTEKNIAFCLLYDECLYMYL